METKFQRNELKLITPRNQKPLLAFAGRGLGYVGPRHAPGRRVLDAVTCNHVGERHMTADDIVAGAIVAQDGERSRIKAAVILDFQAGVLLAEILDILVELFAAFLPLDEDRLQHFIAERWVSTLTESMKGVVQGLAGLMHLLFELVHLGKMFDGLGCCRSVSCGFKPAVLLSLESLS